MTESESRAHHAWSYFSTRSVCEHVSALCVRSFALSLWGWDVRSEWGALLSPRHRRSNRRQASRGRQTVKTEPDLSAITAVCLIFWTCFREKEGPWHRPTLPFSQLHCEEGLIVIRRWEFGVWTCGGGAGGEGVARFFNTLARLFTREFADKLKAYTFPNGKIIIFFNPTFLNPNF